MMAMICSCAKISNRIVLISYGEEDWVGVGGGRSGGSRGREGGIDQGVEEGREGGREGGRVKNAREK